MQPEIAPPGVFISYRRSDTLFPASWLYDILAEQFGPPQIFKDVDSIQPGEDFVEVISRSVRACHTMLIVIGTQWLGEGQGNPSRRIDAENDFVRLEVETALANELRIIPLLIADARMPKVEELPVSIAALARRNAITLSPHRFEADVQKIIPIIERARQDAQRRAEEAAARAAEERAAEAAARAAEERKAQLEREQRQDLGGGSTLPSTGKAPLSPAPAPARSRGLLLVGAALASIISLTVILVVVSTNRTSGGGTTQTSGSPAPLAPCGTVNLAMNPWVGYTANAAVYTYVAKNKLNCNVVQKNLTEQAAWAGFPTREVDLVLENWGHPDLVKQYITDQDIAVDLGPTGNKGVIGWFVPPWLAAAHPDITDWHNLNKYADQFRTTESGDKGQLLDGDPSYVTNDEALVRNLGLNFKVVYGGSETALIQTFRQAQAQKQFLLAYLYKPQWFFDELAPVRVKLPPYTSGCDADPAKVACDYPVYDLNKIASTKFANLGGPAAELAKKFQWTDDDQNEVARSIAFDKMSPDDAAKKWVDANADKVKAWLPAGVS